MLKLPPSAAGPGVSEVADLACEDVAASDQVGWWLVCIQQCVSEKYWHIENVFLFYLQLATTLKNHSMHQPFSSQ